MSVPPAPGVGGAPRRRRRSVLLRVWWRRYQWPVLGAVLLCALVLAYIGAPGGFLTRLNTSLLLLPIGRPAGTEDLSTPLQIARILAPVVFAYATFRAVFALFGERLQDLRAGLARNHAVVCGLGGQGEALVESLLGSTKVVAVELNPANLAVRRLRDNGAVVLVGDATDPEMFRKAKLSHARHAISVCGQDAVNAQVGANLLELAHGKRERPLGVFLHVSDPRLYTFLLHHSFSSRSAQLEFFNIYDRGARGLLDDASLRGGGTPNAVLVVGAGQLGLALVSQIARERFDRLSSEPGAGRVRIHLVDREAHARVQLLADRYSRMQEVCDLEPHEIDVDAPAFDRLLERTPALAEADIAYVCFDNDGLTIAATLNLIDQAHGTFPIVARVTRRSEGIAGMIEEAQSRYADAATFRPLSLAERACRADIVFQGVRGQLARQAHEAYRQGSPGGPYDVPWEELSEEGRERNLRHANDIASQLEAVGFRLGPLIDWGEPLPVLTQDEVERMAEIEHGRWVKERLEEGWRYGPVEDYEGRVHPDLVPWADLPPEQQEIDRRLVRMRPAMLARVGVEIYRG